MSGKMEHQLASKRSLKLDTVGASARWGGINCRFRDELFVRAIFPSFYGNFFNVQRQNWVALLISDGYVISALAAWLARSLTHTRAVKEETPRPFGSVSADGMQAGSILFFPCRCSLIVKLNA